MLPPGSEVTSTTLLQRLADADDADAWHAIDDRYRPVILGLARRLGLGDADAADAAQNAMTQFFVEYRAGKYVRSRGRLRTWLMAMARMRIMDQHRARARKHGAAGLTDAPEHLLSDETALEALWRAEEQQVIVQRALAGLRTRTRLAPQTIALFEAVVIEERRPAEVAEALGVTVAEVYLAKNRVTSHLRDLVNQITAAYEDDRP